MVSIIFMKLVYLFLCKLNKFIIFFEFVNDKKFYLLVLYYTKKL